MSDKTRYYERLATIARQYARTAAAAAERDRLNPPPQCLCGLTPQDVPIMWAVPGPDRYAPTTYHCPACLPAEMIGLVARSVANLPDEP